MKHPSLTGKNIYFLICKTTSDVKALMFQCKAFRNILYANKMLFKFGKVTFPQCSFYKQHNETIRLLFCDRLVVKRIWNQLKSILSNNVPFAIATLQSVIFVFWDLDTNENLILSHLKFKLKPLPLPTT